jgi:hypothetical protein
MESKQRRDEVPKPAVLHPLTIPEVFHQILNQNMSPTRILICMSKDEFIEQLLGDLSPDDPLLSPTLSLLSKSGSIDVTYCSTVPSLLAYLASYSISPKGRTEASSRQISDSFGACPTLMLLFPLGIYAETASESAQGFSRMFASAVEASIRSQQRLILIEPTSHDETGDTKPEDVAASSPREESDELASDPPLPEPNNNPWERHVPILNVTSSKFGSGERGWMGRTVSLRRIAERWFEFPQSGG